MRSPPLFIDGDHVMAMLLLVKDLIAIFTGGSGRPYILYLNILLSSLSPIAFIAVIITLMISPWVSPSNENDVSLPVYMSILWSLFMLYMLYWVIAFPLSAGAVHEISIDVLDRSPTVTDVTTSGGTPMITSIGELAVKDLSGLYE